MSENSNRANGNSWTLLTPGVKESGVENVGSVAGGLKVEEPLSKAPEPSPEANSDLEKHSSEASAHQPETETSSQPQSDPAFTHGSAQAQETQVTSPETNDGRAQLNAAHVDEDPSSISATVEDVSSWTPDHEEQDALTGHSESPDSFSDSYTHISPTSGSLPASVCQERERFKSDEESLRKTTTEESIEVLETKGKEEDGLRKRKISHLGSLDKTEVENDEEGDEEDFQPPQREEEAVFSLNKCILAAVILLGLGTIFFSEADMDSKELRDPTNQEWLNLEVSRDTPVGLQPPDILSKQAEEDHQILVLQAQLQQHQGELKAAEEGEKELLRREELENEYQRIKEELEKVPALQTELKQENERMKEENLKAKKELEALPSLQREVEHLRAKVSQLTQSTERGEPVHPFAASQIPPAGDKRDVPPIERQEIKHRKTGDKKSEKDQRKGDKEWKKKTSGKKGDDEEKKERGTEGEHTKEQKGWKKDKSHQEEDKAGKRKEWMKDKKRDDGKMVKESKDKKDFKAWEEKKERKEDKKGKKDKHVGQDERKGDKKDWKDTGKKKGKEEKEWKLREERKEDKDWKSDKRSGRNDHNEWKGEKEWRKEKSDGKRNDKTEKKWKGEREFSKEYGGKEMKEKHWREKESESKDEEFSGKEMKEKHWREKERESKDEEFSGKEMKEKQWRQKERESKDEEWKREELKEEKKNKAFYHKSEGGKSLSEKEKQRKERDGHGAPDEKTSHHHSEHENYWSRQRARIQHFTGQRETCSGVADCARVEGLSPVGLRDFETLLQSYLNKLQDPEDQTSREEELHKLVKEFFTDGVFTHDQMPFSEFVEDVGDILEDMAEGEDSDSDIEGEESDEDDDDDEMEEFEREAMEKFSLPEELRKVEKKAEQKKESGRVKG